MLSIEGIRYGEVFANLAEHPQLDESEKAAAREVADWFSAGGPDSGLPRPFDGDLLVETGRHEFRRVVVAGVQFVVWPHNAGPRMNVGIDKV
jgi:hypothetical protein